MIVVLVIVIVSMLWWRRSYIEVLIKSVSCYYYVETWLSWDLLGGGFLIAGGFTYWMQDSVRGRDSSTVKFIVILIVSLVWVTHILRTLIYKAVIHTICFTILVKDSGDCYRCTISLTSIFRWLFVLIFDFILSHMPETKCSLNLFFIHFIH